MKSIIFLITFCLSLTSYANSKDLGMVQKLANKYISFAKAGSYGKIYDQLVDKKTKESISRTEFLDAFSFGNSELDKEYTNKGTMNFLFMDVGDISGTVTLKVGQPKIMPIVLDIKANSKDKLLLSSFENMNKEIAARLLTESVEEKEGRLILKVIKVKGFWKISFKKKDLEAQKKIVKPIKDKIYQIVSEAKRSVREENLKDEVTIYYFEHNFDKSGNRVSAVCRSEKKKFMIRPRGLFTEEDCSLKDSIFTCSKEKDVGISTHIYDKKQLCEIGLTDMKNKLKEEEQKDNVSNNPNLNRGNNPIGFRNNLKNGNQDVRKKMSEEKTKDMTKCRMIYFNSGCYKNKQKLDCYSEATKKESIQEKCMDKEIVDQVVR